uniref:palmitoyl-CoA hydrolase n=1 Tax=Oryzias latipes TaxID=8090 RepID=A0A3P9MAZ9_ORYLA
MEVKFICPHVSQTVNYITFMHHETLQAHPGTEVTAVDLFNYGNSTEPMWKQVEGFANVIQKIMEKSPEGVHLLCFSQGGLICRGLLSTLPNHNVHSFIALSSPLAGQFGVPDVLLRYFPLSARELVYLLCYTKDLQESISMCNYWNDPHRRRRYLEYSNFLPLLNGEKPHSKMAAWKKNFLRIKKLVLIGGPDDNVITPWQSSFFGFYNHNEVVVEMKEQTFYKKNTFGLKTLDTRGDISVCSQPGVKHNSLNGGEEFPLLSTMSSRGRNGFCRICGGDLQGNQRRWLFGSQNKKGSQPPTPTESLRGGSLSRSSQSSPWGSTLSLGSSGSLSKSQSFLGSPSKSVDLLSVLTHILGQQVPRGSGREEFVCGKCVSALERVFKFDSVISRVRVLSTERLQKLTQERDKIRQWVRSNYRQRHLQEFQSRSSISEDDGEVEKEAYRDMLKENMALSGYECWSERWDTCPYFIRTGKRCRRGKGCEGCDSLRVSDSDYESVCGIPRHLPSDAFSPLGLSGDRSSSMPLHWQKGPTISSSPASLAGSSLSLRAPSRTQSVQSLDLLEGNDPVDLTGGQPLNFVLMELRGVEAKPVSSPSGSRIPVLGKNTGKSLDKTDGGASPRVSRVLNFAENGKDGMDEEDGDVLMELRDEYMPLRESTPGRVNTAVRNLRAQLDKATSRIRTLEAELKQGGSKPPEANGQVDLGSDGGDGFLLQNLGHSLHSRERLIQECLALIRRLSEGEDASSELTHCLKEVLAENKAALEALRSERSEKEKRLEKEAEALRKAGRDRERDLDTLNTVLRCNQEIIGDLRVALEEKERQLKDVEKERDLWRQRDNALSAVLQDKEDLILSFRQQLESSGTETELAALLKDKADKSATLCQEVSNLTASLQQYQDMVKSQQETHGQTVSALSAQLKEARQELRNKQKEKKEAEREWQNEREDREREAGKLRDSLEKRDKLIERILLDSEERDRLLTELQQNLQNKREPVTAVKHTL